MQNELPQHIAIIMDGNGRWAKKRFLPRTMGHRSGAQALNRLLKEADKLGLKHMTVYAFSTENWSRSRDEVNALMNLLREYVKDYIRDNKTSNIRINAIGDLSALDADIQESIKHLEEISANKPGMFLHIALNYGGRDEIRRAAKKLACDAVNNIINPEDITEELFSQYLDTKDYPDPELIIRTSSEIRLSNFLLWQAAYSELYITDKLWPDFTIDDLNDALKQYNRRERRFGGRKES